MNPPPNTRPALIQVTTYSVEIIVRLSRVLNVWRIQIEAEKLKADPRTKLLASGTINSGVDVTELNNVASPPLDMNVILIYDAYTLGLVLEQIINASCNGPYSFLLLLLLLFYTPGSKDPRG